MSKFLFNVNGIMHRPKKVVNEVSDFAKSGDELSLERDKKNKYDKYAVRVFWNLNWIGYVDSSYSEEISKLIESDEDFSCKILVVDTDIGTRETDSGRYIDYIRYIDMLAEIE